MKKFKIILLVLFFSLTFTNAQFNNEIDNISKKIFELSSKSEYENAAAYFACSEKGDEYLKRSANPQNRNELKFVKKICKKIKGLLKISSGHNFYDHKKYNDKYICFVKFDSGKQDLIFQLTFIKLKNIFLLVNFK